MRVKIESGQDIAHLHELDQKLWTVLSCPTKGLEFCEKTLNLLDVDGDGKIRVNEVVEASKWLCKVLRDPDLLLLGQDYIAISDFNQEDEEGKILSVTARQILETLGLEKDNISIADTSDSMAIFAKTRFNGDGIITMASTDDDTLKKVIEAVMNTVGKVTDKSGEDGVNADQIEEFYTACNDFITWKDSLKSDEFPYGENTDAALAACDAIKDKIADYFMRCKFIAFDEDCTNALDVNVAKVEEISGGNLATCTDQISSYPLARPRKDALLPISNGINPAWQSAFSALKTTILDVDFPGKDAITEQDWNTVLSKFAAYIEWKGSKKGEKIESQEESFLREVVQQNRKEELLAIVEQDKAVADEVAAIDTVDKLLYLYRDFYKLLKNYVIFSDFYSRTPGSEAVFQAGRLFIDQRCCELCVRVTDMAKHADMAAQSGMYLIYCNCVSKSKNQKMDIVAVLTEGNVEHLRVGKNGIFYDRNGLDWDATVTKIVDNPISIKQAFWSPYRKFWNWVTEKINKTAAEKESSSFENMTAKAQTKMDQAKTELAEAKDNPDAVKKEKPAPQAFDIAKFAGIFAAIGMAIGYIASAAAGITETVGKDPKNLIILIVGIILVISGPSMFIAWTKLRKRNLGPILNANGWAINSQVLVNTIFGATLTSLAKYPKFDIKSMSDPFVKEGTPAWKKWLISIVIILVLVFGALFFTDNLKCIGLPFHKEQPTCIEETSAPIEDAAPEPQADVAPETPAE